MFSAGLSVVWVSDLSCFDQVLDGVFELKAIVSEVADSLVKLAVSIWVVVW